jgi:hypothetical protein
MTLKTVRKGDVQKNKMLLEFSGTRKISKSLVFRTTVDNTLEDKDMANVNHMTRPDLALSYLCSHLSEFVQCPGMLHLEAVERVLQCERATRLTI